MKFSTILDIRIPAIESPHNVAIMTTIAIKVIRFIVSICDNLRSLSIIYLKENKESDQACSLDFL